MQLAEANSAAYFILVVIDVNYGTVTEMLNDYVFVNWKLVKQYLISDWTVVYLPQTSAKGIFILYLVLLIENFNIFKTFL